ncbi:MAG TPA: hypothetical protein PK530_25380 [Anaerolineales bacterium]|nr:hypothetical protein [Anaerolineales bacterium]
MGLILLIQHFQGEAETTHSTFYLPFVSQGNPPAPTPVPPVATAIPQAPPVETSSTDPTLFAVGIIVLIVFLLILWVLANGKRDRLSQFSPDQQKALRMQNHALGLWVIVLLSVFCGCPLLTVVPLVGPLVQNTSQAVTVLLVLFGVGTMGFIALSSIFSEASILRGRMQKDFAKGKLAIWNGVMLLLAIGYWLFLWLSRLGN